MAMSVITRNRLLAFQAEREQMRAKQALYKPLTEQIVPEQQPQQVGTVHSITELATEGDQLSTKRSVTNFWKSHGYEQVKPRVAFSESEIDTMIKDEEISTESFMRAFGHLNAEHIHRDAYGRWWAKAPAGEQLRNGKGLKGEVTARRRKPNVLRRATVFSAKLVWGTLVLAADMVAEIFFHAGQALALFFTPPVWLVWNTVNAGLRGGAYMWRAIRPGSEGANRVITAARRVSMLEVASELMGDLGMLALVPSWLLQPLGGNAGLMGHQLRKARLFEYVVSLDDTRIAGRAAMESYSRTLDRIEILEARIKQAEARQAWAGATDQVQGKKARAKAKPQAKAQVKANGAKSVLTALERESQAFAKETDPHKKSRLYGISEAVAAVKINQKILTNKRTHDRVRTSLQKKVQPRNSGYYTADVLRGFDSAVRQLRGVSETELTAVA